MTFDSPLRFAACFRLAVVVFRAPSCEPSAEVMNMRAEKLECQTFLQSARAPPTTSTREWYARLWRTVWAPSYRHAELGPRKEDEVRLVSTQTASSMSFLSGRGESGWCSDVTSAHGAWRHAGIRFLLPGVSAPNLSYLPRSPAVPRTLARPSAKKA